MATARMEISTSSMAIKTMGATAFISVHAIRLPITLAITLAMGKMHKTMMRLQPRDL